VVFGISKVMNPYRIEFVQKYSLSGPKSPDASDIIMLLGGCSQRNARRTATYTSIGVAAATPKSLAPTPRPARYDTGFYARIAEKN
jgi:hypothetical protein